MSAPIKINTLENIFERCTPEPNSGCWLWLGTLSPRGYGQLTGDNRTAYPVHRRAYELKHNCTIPKGIYACHKCDVRLCANPDHIFLGTQSDNITDCARKGRHGRQRLTKEQVYEIHRMGSEGYTGSEIAEKFHINPAHARKIIRGLMWKFLNIADPADENICRTRGAQ